MTSSPDTDSTIKASLHNLQAARIPLIQRLNQQFVVESSYHAYENDIQALGKQNRSLLHSIDEQQSRLRAMQSMLRQNADNKDNIASHRFPENNCAPITIREQLDLNENDSEIGISGNIDTDGSSLSLQNNIIDDRSKNGTNYSFLNTQDISIHRREQRAQRNKSKNKCQSVSFQFQSEDKADSDCRRSQFLYRIAAIEQSMNELEAMKDEIPVQQAYLARKMQQQQHRILSLLVEIERVSPLEDTSFVSSDLLHACSQTFTKKHFVRRLQSEMISCRETIAAYRIEMISLNQKLKIITADMDKKREQLGDRKAALLQYDKQRNAVSKMRIVVSKEPQELKKHFLMVWRKDVANRRKKRNILQSTVAIIRRQQFKRAWKHWTRLGQSSTLSTAKEQIGGIGTDDLLRQEARLQDNINESFAILRKFLKTDEQIDDQANANSSKNNLLGEEDEAILLKGEFLLNAEHYEASLKCFERVETAIQSQYISGETAAIELHATVVNKIARIHLALQAIDLALVYFGRSLSLAQEKSHLERYQVLALIGLGECYMQKHDFHYACDFLQQALPLICDEDSEMTVYLLLQQCYDHMNKPEEVAFYSSKIHVHDMRDTRKERVEEAFNKIDSLRQKLIDVSASNSRVVTIQPSSTKHVALAKQMKATEKELLDVNRALTDAKEFSSQLKDLEHEIIAEMEAATNAKKKWITSLRIHDSSQEIKKKELLFRLREKLNMARAKQEECHFEITSLERKARNLLDDMSDLKEEAAVEVRPLIERVLELRTYRCVALNSAANAAHTESGGLGFVALSNGKECYIHNMESGEMETVFMGDVKGQHVGESVGHTSTITALFFHGTRVYTGSVDATLICWELESEDKLYQSKGHEAAITCIFSDETKTLSGAADKSIIVWSPGGLLLHRITGHVGGIHNINCGVSWFASSSYGTIFVWEMIHRHEADRNDIVRIKCRQRLTLSQGNVTALQFSESELVTGDNMGYVKLWNIKSEEVMTSVKAHQSAVTSLQVDATKAVSCGLDMIVQVIDIIQGSVIQTLHGHTKPIKSVAFDQKRVVSVASDGEIRFWSWGNRLCEMGSDR